MKFYEVTIILDGKQQERLENLAKRFKKINGWDEGNIMQFIVNGLISGREDMLTFMEEKVVELKKVCNRCRLLLYFSITEGEIKGVKINNSAIL